MHQIRQAFLSVIGSWYEGKLYIENALAISNDALHVLLGFVAWIGLATVLRRPLTSWLPFAGLAIVLLWNELADLCVEQWPDRVQQYGESVKDALLTMLVPALILLAARYRPQLFGAARR